MKFKGPISKNCKIRESIYGFTNRKITDFWKNFKFKEAYEKMRHKI